MMIVRPLVIPARACSRARTRTVLSASNTSSPPASGLTGKASRAQLSVDEPGEPRRARVADPPV